MSAMLKRIVLQAWLTTVNDGKAVTNSEAKWVVYMTSTQAGMNRTGVSKSKYADIVDKTVKP